MDEFTKKEASEAIHLPLRAIQYYTERNVVEPEVNSGEGKGSKRLYSKKNLVELAIIKALAEYKIAFPVVKDVMHLLRYSMININEGKKIEDYRGGIFEVWEKTAVSAFIELYKTEKRFLPVFCRVPKGKRPTFDPTILDKSESILIIDFGRIVRMVRKL